ncbi:MAG: 4Fe-4S dicluster domain-containing protein [Desulfobacterales bacterium]|nr:4Fe-4S dicluster domain-containing protein [Desulfobacterales bacterium]
MGMRIAFTEELCTNCHLCAMFCSLAFTKNGIFEFRPSISRIRVIENEDDTKYVAHVCLQCESPACVDACPVEAIAKDPESGLVMIDEDECTECEMCIEACEFDCLFMVDGITVKCEVCDDPLCVRACAVKALELAEWDEESVLEQGELYKEVRL